MCQPLYVHKERKKGESMKTLRTEGQTCYSRWFHFPRRRRGCLCSQQSPVNRKSKCVSSEPVWPLVALLGGKGKLTIFVRAQKKFTRALHESRFFSRFLHSLEMYKFLFKNYKNVKKILFVIFFFAECNNYFTKKICHKPTCQNLQLFKYGKLFPKNFNTQKTKFQKKLLIN